MIAIADTATRVPEHTAHRINEEIAWATEQRLRDLAGHPDAILHRLDELDEEWDTERVLAFNSAALTLTGLALGATLDRRWLLLSGAVQLFFIQHALQGWCPPLPVIRRLGVRTAREIEDERHALLDMLDEMAPVAQETDQLHASGEGGSVRPDARRQPARETGQETGREADHAPERQRAQHTEEAVRATRGSAPEAGAPGGW